MPTYCYMTSDGEIIERDFSMGGAPSKIRVHGKVAHRNRAAEQVRGTVRGTKTPIRRGGWPMEPCIASGVHPSQANELREFLKKSGVPTEVTEHGDPIYTSPGHQKKALKARGLHLKNSFD